VYGACVKGRRSLYAAYTSATSIGSFPDQQGARLPMTTRAIPALYPATHRSAESVGALALSVGGSCSPSCSHIHPSVWKEDSRKRAARNSHPAYNLACLG
jgi:hypothetical protein